MRPLLQSKLYHILMTFNVMANVDTLFETAYLALLCNALVFLWSQPNNRQEWHEHLYNLIYKTMKIMYGESKGFKNYLKTLDDLNDTNKKIKTFEEIKVKSYY